MVARIPWRVAEPRLRPPLPQAPDEAAEPAAERQAMSRLALRRRRWPRCVAGCGSTQEVREPTLVVRGPDAEPARAPASAGALAATRCGSRSSPTARPRTRSGRWCAAGSTTPPRQLDVSIDYRAPDTFNLERMRRLIDRAVDERPDGMVVTIPDARVLGRSIRRAVQAGIPVVSINSGADEFRRLGVLAHVGQTEDRAGRLAGERMAAEGVRDALCVNQEVGNSWRSTSAAARSARALRPGRRALAACSRSACRTRPARSGASPRRSAAGGIDGILTLGPGGASPALAALRAGGLASKVKLATFDLSPEVLTRAARRAAAVRDRPAALPAGLPAGDDAGPEQALRRSSPTRARSCSPARTSSRRTTRPRRLRSAAAGSAERHELAEELLERRRRVVGQAGVDLARAG